MKQRKITKKAMALLLAVAMIVTSFPFLSREVHAADNELPEKTQFATVNDLKSFNTNDNDGEVNPAKVYFGWNNETNTNQQWWIAGSQNNDGVVLFATNPLETNQKFSSNSNTKPYDETWKCTYPIGVTITEVNPDHYGASNVRARLKSLETSYFSYEEQKLMKDTTIYTHDTKNNSIYSTTDKLYLAYGEETATYITVGANTSDNLNNGLRIYNTYWGQKSYSWLRKGNGPSIAVGYFNVLTANTYYGSGRVANLTTNSNTYVTTHPAFELNISDVLFGSTVPAVYSNGQQTINDAFTLRYKADNLGSAFVPYAKNEVQLKDVPNGTYLVVQNSKGAYAKEVGGTTSVSSKDMGLDNFENCKVWLETTDTSNRMTYATLATEEKGIAVSISAGTGLSITSSNGVQEVAPNTPITSIKVQADSGYYFTDEYVEQLNSQLNGLTVTKVDDYKLTITGTPTSDMNITLPAATALPKADMPQVDLKTTSTSITATVTNYQDIFGNIEYKWNEGNWEQDKNTLSNLQPETTYKLAVRFTGNGFYQLSEERTVEITTLKDGNAVLVVPTDLTATYAEGLTLSSVPLPSGWAWVDPDIELSAGTKSYSAVFNTTALESTTDFSNVDGYDETTHTITRDIEVKVEKADSQIEITTPNMDKKYDGKVVSNPEVNKTGSTNEVTFTWYQEQADGTWKELNGAPTSVGTYKVVASVAEDGNYKAATAEKEFNISIADNEWTNELSITGWTYGQSTNMPTANAKFGTVEFTYSVTQDGTYDKTVPTNAGTYYVKATVTGNENYTSLESIKEFTIKKADSNISITTQDMNKVYDGKAVENPTFNKTGSTNNVAFTWYQKQADGTWKELYGAPTSVGNYKVVASVAEDTNYNGVSVEKEFSIGIADNNWTEELSINDWTYGDNANTPSAKAKFGDVTFLYSSEENGTYTETVPTDAGIWYVKATVAGNENYKGLESAPVKFEITKAESKIEIITPSLDKLYDGSAVNEPEYTTSGSDGTVTIKWQENRGTTDSPVWEDLKNAPSVAGNYRVVVELAENDNYNATSTVLEFVISKNPNAWKEELSIADWTYGESANTPNAKAQFGNVTFTYSNKKDGTYTEIVPTDAGTYYVKATVTGTENYAGLEAVVSFEIKKAVPTYEKVTDLVIKQGQSLSEIELPKQFKWVDDTQTVDTYGMQTFKAIYTPEDTANYQTIEVDIEVEVLPTPVELNHVPTINASEKTLTVGDTFDPLKDVTAADKEDGDITKNIKVIKNTVDTDKAGTYEVTYQVTDTQGATDTKSIKVIVKDKEVEPNTDKPNNEKGKDSVDTKDQTNVGLYTSMFIMSALGIAVLLILKKKKVLEHK